MVWRNPIFPGLGLEADDPATLIRRVEEIAPELVAPKGKEVARRSGVKAGEALRLNL